MGDSGRRSVGMFNPRLIRLVACVVLIALLPLAAGCYGSFPLTHIIYQFNGEVTHSDLVHSIIFWVFIIIPVYWVGLLGDVIVLNLIEFWTGEKMAVSTQTLPDGTVAALAPSADGREAALTVCAMARCWKKSGLSGFPKKRCWCSMKPDTRSAGSSARPPPAWRSRMLRGRRWSRSAPARFRSSGTP